LYALNVARVSRKSKRARAARLLRERSPPLPRQVAQADGYQPNGGRVIYRKGELGKHMIDRDWPHQVALPAAVWMGRNYVTIRLFCEGLSFCPRGHSFCRNNTDMNVFCFAERAHAERFHERFGGEFIDPKSRPK
jgi:hypothetical protein